jgi:hypothetical protein
VSGPRPAPAGDVDYEAHGPGYAGRRRPDARIAARVHAALGAARTVVNVGAGAGSYEPPGRCVVPVEPSAAMRAQRPRAARLPAVGHVRAVLGGTSIVEEVPVPLHCTDGFTEAYYGRPERFLDPEVRRSQSVWGFVDPGAARRGVERLERDLATGAWDARFGALRTQPEFVGALRLIVAHP